MKYNDSFLGEIDLIKVGETNRHSLDGKLITDTLYKDNFGGIYIEMQTINDNKAMIFLRRSIIDLIKNLNL